MTTKYPTEPFLLDPNQRGALYRALCSHFPHSIPNRDDLYRFVSEWMLTQDLSKPYLTITDVTAIADDWFGKRKAGVL